jgi:ElaB/YqjD/DUF883 family membrane-anchored ribosome-binding protein
VVRQIGELARTAAQGIESSASEAGDELRATLGQTREQLDQVERDLRRALKRSVRTTERYVQARPWSAIVMAAAAALLVGAVLGSWRK